MEPGGLWWTNVLNLALPPQRHRSDTRPEHQDPVSHTAQKKREKRKRERERGREGEREKGIKGERKKGRKEERKEERKDCDDVVDFRSVNN